MGHSADLFIDKDISDGFLCAICRDVLKDPVAMNTCEHTFCRDCTIEWRKKSKTCPIDRQQVPSFKKVQRNFINVLNELKMRCPFTGDGCTATFKLGDFSDHDERCRFNPVNQKECAGGCGAILNQAQVKAKTHDCIGYLKKQVEDREKLVQAKDTELGVKVKEVTGLQAELKAKEIMLKEKEVQLKTKDAQLTNFKEQQILDLDHQSHTSTSTKRKPCIIC